MIFLAYVRTFVNIPTIFHYLAPLIGFTTLFIGIAATIWPEPMSKKFGISASSQAIPYVMSTGIRDVFMGLVVLILFNLQLWEALGLSIICLGIVAFSDFIVVRKYGDKKVSLVHLAACIIVLVYGFWLL